MAECTWDTSAPRAWEQPAACMVCAIPVASLSDRNRCSTSGQRAAKRIWLEFIPLLAAFLHLCEHQAHRTSAFRGALEIPRCLSFWKEGFCNGIHFVYAVMCLIRSRHFCLNHKSLSDLAKTWSSAKWHGKAPHSYAINEPFPYASASMRKYWGGYYRDAKNVSRDSPWCNFQR